MPAGSFPACWLLLDNREHIEAIRRDYCELDAENRLVAEQRDEAKRRAAAAERTRDDAQAALDQTVMDLALQREKHATTTELF